MRGGTPGPPRIPDELFPDASCEGLLIASVEEARLAVRLGADALGLVSAMPRGPGVIAEELIAEIARSTPPPVATFSRAAGKPRRS